MPDTTRDAPKKGRITGDDRGVADPGGSRPAPGKTDPAPKQKVQSGDRNAMTRQAPATTSDT